MAINKMSKWGQKIEIGAQWFFGVMITLGAIGGFVSGEVPKHFPALMLVGGVILIPPIRHRFGGPLAGKAGIALGIALFVLGGVFANVDEREKAKEAGFSSLSEYQKALRLNRKADAAIEKPDFTKVTKTVIESDRPPFKKSVEVYLSERITKAQVAAISKDIRAKAGSGYKNVFIGFRIPNGGGMYWATGHHSPTLDARIVGMTREQYGIAKKRIENVTLAIGEQLLAKALILGSGWARMVLILKNGDGYIERTYWLPSDKPTDQPLTKKGGRYWSREEGSTVNFRITKSKIEIHDNLGPISSGYRE